MRFPTNPHPLLHGLRYCNWPLLALTNLRTCPFVTPHTTRERKQQKGETYYEYHSSKRTGRSNGCGPKQCESLHFLCFYPVGCMLNGSEEWAKVKTNHITLKTQAMDSDTERKCVIARCPGTTPFSTLVFLNPKRWTRGSSSNVRPLCFVPVLICLQSWRFI